ncbi:cupin domain-containing protein [Pseudonocardia halophobica]|uniref:Cupin n=1 Tax=Pseudonocardia halophobica TaxID=29401 RepID=A0A9W6L8E7_9PSEU|nr:cupin domain-containing protein [Pseudonocardia halophobica]GLL14044.1 cupin [Pseudonocardia halophobica]
MITQIRQIITGHDENGKSILVSDHVMEPVQVAAIYGSEFYMVWGTEGPEARVGMSAEGPTTTPFFPRLGGTRFVLLRYAPDSSVPENIGDPDEVAAEVAEKLDGMFEPFEAGNPKMHTTDSIDYAFCVEGEMWMELDDGQEVHLTPGTCLVQRGTRHAWHNRSDKPSLMLYVLVGASRS